MKKIGFIFLLCLSFVLGACGQTNQETSGETATATLEIRSETSSEKQEVTFEVGDTVMDLLEEYHTVEEESGMVTAIDGVSQDPASQTYWMYKVNGQLAEKGASELLVQSGDQIEFYLETFE